MTHRVGVRVPGFTLSTSTKLRDATLLGGFSQTDGIAIGQSCLQGRRQAGYTSSRICGDESQTDALKSVDQHGIRFRSILNLSVEGAAATELFGVEHWPLTFVLDRTGVIRYRDLTGVDLEEAVTLLLNEKDPKSEQ